MSDKDAALKVLKHATEQMAWHRVNQRQVAILALAAGAKVGEVARVANVSQSTVRRWNTANQGKA